MKGNIYPAKNKCPACGGKFQHVDGQGIRCPKHPEQTPKSYLAKYGRQLIQRFKTYEQAWMQLAQWRQEDHQGRFDPRDYKQKSDLQFSLLAERYIEHKKLTVQSWRIYQRHLGYAAKKLGERNFKSIDDVDLEQLVFDLRRRYSEKTVHDAFTTLREFWKWAIRHGRVKDYEPPQFPRTEPVMAERDTLRKDQQLAVLNQIQRMNPHNPRIYLATRFMVTYINCRPAEIMNIKVGDIRWDTGRIYIPDPKEKKPKYIDLIPQDLEFLADLIGPDLDPAGYVFCHVDNRNGNATTGQKWGKTFMWRQWKKACESINLKGVSLYPGTRHTSAKALLQGGHTPEQIMRTTGHTTKSAFARYLTVDEDERRSVFAATSPAEAVTHVLHIENYRKQGKSAK